MNNKKKNEDSEVVMTNASVEEIGGNMTPEELFQKGVEACNASQYVIAKSYFLKAAEQGHTSAMVNLYSYYIDEYYEDEMNQEEAFQWLRKAADLGNSTAQYKLGCCYMNGEGVQENKVEGAKWYRKAADQNDREAQFQLAIYYDFEEEDYETAFGWYKKAADNGHILGAYEIAWEWKNKANYKRAMEYFRIVADSDEDEAPNDTAMLEIGLLYYYGHGVEKDEYEALLWFKKSVDIYTLYPRRHWTERVESILSKYTDDDVWEHLKKYIDEEGNLKKP